MRFPSEVGGAFPKELLLYSNKNTLKKARKFSDELNSPHLSKNQYYILWIQNVEVIADIWGKGRDVS